MDEECYVYFHPSSVAVLALISNLTCLFREMVVSLSALMTSVTAHLCDLMLTQPSANPHVKSQALDCIDAARKLVSNIKPNSAKRKASTCPSPEDQSHHAAKKSKVPATTESNLSMGTESHQQSFAQFRPDTEKRNLTSIEGSTDGSPSQQGVPVVNKPGFPRESRPRLSDLLSTQNASDSHRDSHSSSSNESITTAKLPETVSVSRQMPAHNNRGKSEAYINNKTRQFHHGACASGQAHDTWSNSHADASIKTTRNQANMEGAEARKPLTCKVNQDSCGLGQTSLPTNSISHQPTSTAFHGINAEICSDQDVVFTGGCSPSTSGFVSHKSREQMGGSKGRSDAENESEGPANENEPAYSSSVPNTGIGHQSPMECDVGSLFSFLDEEPQQSISKSKSSVEKTSSNVAQGGYSANWGDSNSLATKAVEPSQTGQLLKPDDRGQNVQLLTKAYSPATSTSHPQTSAPSRLQQMSAITGPASPPGDAAEKCLDTTDVSYQSTAPACVSHNYHHSCAASSQPVSHEMFKGNAIGQMQKAKGGEYSSMLKKKIRSQVAERQANNEKKMGGGEGNRNSPGSSGAVSYSTSSDVGEIKQCEDVIDVETYKTKDPRLNKLQQHQTLPYYNVQAMAQNGSLFSTEMDDRRNLFERMRPLALRKEMREFDTARDIRRHLSFESPDYKPRKEDSGPTVAKSPEGHIKPPTPVRHSSKQKQIDDIRSHSVSPASTPICDEQYDDSFFSHQSVPQYTCTACKYNGSNENYTFMTEAGLQQHTLTTHRISTCDVMA